MTFLKKNKIYILLGIILLIGLWLRLLPVATYLKESPTIREDLILFGDAKGYHDMSLIFFNHGISGILDASNEIYISPEIPALTAFRTPLYPYFISLIYNVNGINPLLVLLTQVGLNVIVIYLIFEIAELIFKKKYLSLFAAFLYAINPIAIAYSLSMYAESLFSFFFVLTILFFIHACQKNNKWWRFGIVGILLGISTLIKPITLYFLPVFFVSLIFLENNFFKNWKKYLSKCALIFIFFIIILTPWQLRNFYMFNHYAVTFQQGRELLVWRVGTCMAWSQKLEKRTLWVDIQKPFLDVSDIFERSKLEQQQALNYIYNNPTKYLSCNLKGIEKFFISRSLPSNLGIGKKTQFLESVNSVGMASNFFRYFNIDKNLTGVINLLYLKLLYIQYLIILLGSILLFKKKEFRGFIMFCFFTVGYFVLVAGVDSYFRYRYPILPILTLLTLASIWVIIENIKLISKKFKYKCKLKKTE